MHASYQWREVRLGALTPFVERRPDGTILLRAAEPLEPYPATLTDRLAHWADVAPDRTLLAWTAGSGFATLTYAEAMRRIRGIGQALLDRGLSGDRPLAILSGNDVHHLLLALAAQHVGIPYAPVSPAYSLVTQTFAQLRHIAGVLSPGLVFVSERARFARALDAAISPDVEVVSAESFDEQLATAPRGEVDRRHAAIAPDDIAKILFTSGSTGAPKGVINTHRMICSNQQMILQALPLLGDEPPVLVDWLPWHHTFGGNHNIGIVIYNGGTYYIDEGRPVAGGFAESVRMLRAVAPTIYLNVPKGYDELVRAFKGDAALARMFFARVKVLFYAAAGLPQHLADDLQQIAIDSCGERLILVTGLGSTETAPMAICRPWPSEISSAIGLPVPGVETKLAPSGEKLEVRVRGPNVTPGYWRQTLLTEAAFDEEGFYCMGDAVRLVDPDDLSKGLLFDGRLKEDFKLSTGTWVSVGPLRARILQHFAPYVRDAIITGHDRDEVGMLAVPDVDACRALVPDLAADVPAPAVLGHEAVRTRIRELMVAFAATATGSATRIVRAVVLEEPPSLDAGEVTDKGSLNQRAVLDRRCDLVAAMYAETPPANVIVCAALVR
ncbi:MAG TPA: feruloyl-CoA synthase [Vicinamibacterales bacterium]|nr:feruloyl-CoA synthase [Vicinamibacterales bacterium]